VEEAGRPLDDVQMAVRQGVEAARINGNHSVSHVALAEVSAISIICPEAHSQSKMDYWHFPVFRQKGNFSRIIPRTSGPTSPSRPP